MRQSSSHLGQETMTLLPPEDPILEALLTSQAHLCTSRGKALRFPAQVAPFCALRNADDDAVADLRALVVPGETLFLPSRLPASDDCAFRNAGSVPCLQMSFPETVPIPWKDGLPITTLQCSDAEAMLSLIAVAYPGYFRPQTCRMGRYFGILDEIGELGAMVGERMVAGPWREISALCVHPNHAGKGLGSLLLAHLLCLHRQEGSRSWLWVTASNVSAQRLYQHFGFDLVRETTLHRVERLAEGTE